MADSLMADAACPILGLSLGEIIVGTENKMWIDPILDRQPVGNRPRHHHSDHIIIPLALIATPL